VAFKQDGPFSVIDTMTFNDTNNKPILGPLGGHDLYLIGKYGGYHFSDDAKQSSIYTASRPAPAAPAARSRSCSTSRSRSSKRDALGALPNKSASATFDVNLRLAPIANIYSTAPTAPRASASGSSSSGGWTPNAADLRGNAVAQNPPAVQTTQYWQKQSYTLNAGALNQRLWVSTAWCAR
jgi:hypothetical protein